MATRSVLLKLVLLTVVLCCTTWPCVPAQAGGFGAPASDAEIEHATSWVTPWMAPILEWLGWDGNGALLGLAEGSGAEAPEGISTSGFDSNSTSDEEDDRGTAADPNG